MILKVRGKQSLTPWRTYIPTLIINQSTCLWSNHMSMNIYVLHQIHCQGFLHQTKLKIYHPLDISQAWLSINLWYHIFNWPMTCNMQASIGYHEQDHTTKKNSNLVLSIICYKNWLMIILLLFKRIRIIYPCLAMAHIPPMMKLSFKKPP